MGPIVSCSCFLTTFVSRDYVLTFHQKFLTIHLGATTFRSFLESNIALPTVLKRVARGKLEQADRGLFRLNATLDASLLETLSPENATLYVTKHIISTAVGAILQSCENIPKRCKLWWNKECTKTV